MVVDELMDTSLIELDIDVQSKQDVFEHAAKRLKQHGYIEDGQTFIHDLYLREAEGTTNLMTHIALPHSQSDTIIQSSISLFRFKETVDWEDEQDPVKVVFVIAVSPHQKNITHLEAIASLAGLLMEESFIQQLLNTNNKKDLLTYIKKEIGGTL